jgi:DEAD/DEAH box helicase domain-containing protein
LRLLIIRGYSHRGAFGAHVSGVLRRLLRVCLYYGRCPQFLCCSATIANPAEHMLKLVPLSALYVQCSPIPTGPLDLSGKVDLICAVH